MAFQKGKSGNPSGRPKGTSDKRTSLRAMLAPHAEELISKLVEQAKGGNIGAMKLLIERIVPPIREHHIEIQLPDVNTIAACAMAQAQILSAVASGQLLPSEGDTLSGMVDNRRKALEASEIIQRITALEERL